MARSRRPRTSRLTPLRTTIRISGTLCNQRVQGGADEVVFQLDPDARLSGRVEQDEPGSAVDRFLVPGERCPRRVAVDPHRLRVEELLDGALFLLETGEPERREEP